MEEQLIKLFSIFLFTMFKFIAGPSLGYLAGYSYLATVALTVAGMMSSVFLFTFLGKILREKFLIYFFRRRKIFSRNSRRFVSIWHKYGEIGVAVLTPILFTPIGGTLMLTSTGTRKKRIVIYMLISGTFWAFVISGLIYHFGDTFLHLLKPYLP